RRPRRPAPQRRGGGVSDQGAKTKGTFGRMWGAKSAAEPQLEERSEDVKPAAASGGFFDRLKRGLGKTSSKLSDGITGLFTKLKLDATTLDELEDVLIEADLGIDTAERIVSLLGKGRYDKGIEAEDVRTVLKSEVERVLAPVAQPLEIDVRHKPHVILVIGVN